MNKTQILINHSSVSEKEIERYLVDSCHAQGLLCLKYSNANMVGFPDRIIVVPGGSVVWVELKSKGRKPSKIQQLRIARLRAMGHAVYVADSKSLVDEVIKAIRDAI